ncbi:MAG: hypothetical protein J0L61_02245 [Planctomycetes bacterium]|nr:hypothetical protein [Planctomycetota bacterium]
METDPNAAKYVRGPYLVLGRKRGSGEWCALIEHGWSGVQVCIGLAHDDYEGLFVLPLSVARAGMDLFEACKLALEQNWGQPKGVSVPALDPIRAAVAKAEGGAA